MTKKYTASTIKVVHRFKMYKIHSNHEFKNILKSDKLLPLTYKVNLSVRKTALKEKVNEIS